MPTPSGPNGVIYLGKAINPRWWSVDSFDGRIMSEILAARDVGAVMKYLHDEQGFTWSTIGALVDLPESRVRDFAAGRRRVTAYDVLVRIATGLQIPRHLMGLGRETLPGAPIPTKPRAMTDLMVTAFAAPAVRQALAAAGPSTLDHQDAGRLPARAFTAWEQRDEADKPLLVLVGGYAGSGKTEFARFLTAMTGWAVLDKDVISRPLVEELLRVQGGDPNDRQGELYLNRVRPLEYQCLINAAMMSIREGASVVVTAPFLMELPNLEWLTRLQAMCTGHGAELAIIWLTCDLDSMYAYLHQRDAARDMWKLTHWDEYRASVNLDLRPATPHVVVDNSQQQVTSLADNARRILTMVRPQAMRVSAGGVR